MKIILHYSPFLLFAEEHMSTDRRWDESEQWRDREREREREREGGNREIEMYE